MSTEPSGGREAVEDFIRRLADCLEQHLPDYGFNPHRYPSGENKQQVGRLTAERNEARAALAAAWDQGRRTGTSRAMRHMSDEPNLPLASADDNPYLAAPLADQGERHVDGILCQAETRDECDLDHHWEPPADQDQDAYCARCGRHRDWSGGTSPGAPCMGCGRYPAAAAVPPPATDYAHSSLVRLQQQVGRLTAERDEARAAVGRLRALVERGHVQGGECYSYQADLRAALDGSQP